MDLISSSYFDTFWKSYPKKFNKQKCKRWFDKYPPSPELFNLIMSKLEVFKNTKQWKKNAGEFVPYAVTWLNQERWNDEIAEEEVIKPKKAECLNWSADEQFRVDPARIKELIKNIGKEME